MQENTEQIISPFAGPDINTIFGHFDSLISPVTSWTAVCPSWLVIIVMALLLILLYKLIPSFIQLFIGVLAWLWLALISNFFKWLIYSLIPFVKGIFLAIGSGFIRIVKSVSNSVVVWLGIATTLITTYLTRFHEQIVDIISNLVLPTMPYGLSNADYSGLLYLFFNHLDLQYFLIKLFDLGILYLSVKMIVLFFRMVLKMLNLV